jgi:hypothetical protein
LSEQTDALLMGVLPSAFMRQLRPELFSDSKEKSDYRLDPATFENHLETITSRNQTHDFEIFCRKLCERAVCPNLRPQTGPEGGGDSKVDSETLPVSDELAVLFYSGEANASSERWAFAFSAKKKWVEKVRKDVNSIIETNRGYQRIFCVTNQFAKANTRAKLEDELSKQHNLKLTILDRTWIVKEVIENSRKDIAFNYLKVGEMTSDPRRLGPTDYSRTQQLEDIEKALADADSFNGMKSQQVAEAIVAAKLSRNMERPRVETDGRFLRAVRLADSHGSYRQKLEAQYESLWTAYWWFNDISLLNSKYDEFETHALKTDNAKNLSFLSNLFQLLVNSVIHGHVTAEECKLATRTTSLIDKLNELIGDGERPNNRLEAKTSLLTVKLNQAVLSNDSDAISKIWPELRSVLEEAKGLGEYDANSLIKLIEVFGAVAGDDPDYNLLIDDTAKFVSERRGEGEGALILLKRAQQLDLENNFEMIRLLGKATLMLTKEEYAEQQIEALQLLSVAYKSAGLLWAARASCIFALASIIIKSEEESELRLAIIPTLDLLAWLSIQLRHLPDFLASVQLLNGILRGVALDEDSKKRLGDKFLKLDMAFASNILNFNVSELQQVERLPDIFEAVGLAQSRSALIYVLGHEKILRDEKALPEEESAEKILEFYSLLASQPVSNGLDTPLIFNIEGLQNFRTIILGVKIDVSIQVSDASVLVAEAILGSLEAFLATAIEHRIFAHTEKVHITVFESEECTRPEFSFDQETMTAKLVWPKGKLLSDFSNQSETHELLIEVVALTLGAVFINSDFKAMLEKLCRAESVMERIRLIAVIGNSYHRVFGRRYTSTEAYSTHMSDRYPLQSFRPTLARQELKHKKDSKDQKRQVQRDSDGFYLPTDHREVVVKSVIDVHLWDQAGWKGVGYVNSFPPTMAFLFTNKEIARKIFERWRERFGDKDVNEEIYIAVIKEISDQNPFYYNVLITSQPPTEKFDENIKLITQVGRYMTMEPQSALNLSRFIADYKSVKSFNIVPAIWREGRPPEFLPELSILKRQVVVKIASDVGENDIEHMALPK